jgi:hypothetical protein
MSGQGYHQGHIECTTSIKTSDLNVGCWANFSLSESGSVFHGTVRNYHDELFEKMGFFHRSASDPYSALIGRMSRLGS